MWGSMPAPRKAAPIGVKQALKARETTLSPMCLMLAALHACDGWLERLMGIASGR
jgi:hypothetical protein